MPRRLNWNEIRRRHPERMANHLEALNSIHRDGARAREQRIRALLGVMAEGPLPSWELRDELAQAWAEVYNEEMTSKSAWLEVRFGIRRGLFVLRPDGKYDTIRPHGQENTTGGMGDVPSEGDPGGASRP